MSVLSIDVAVKGLRENARDRRGLVFIVALPLLLMAIMALGYGSGDFIAGGSIPHEAVVINKDAGVLVTANNTTTYVNYGANFTDVLANATAKNSTTHLFHLHNASEDKADDLLKSKSIDTLIIIPENFSAAFTTMVNNSTRMVIESSVGRQAITNASNAGFGIGAIVTLPTAGNTTTTVLVEGDGADLNFVSAQGLFTGIFDQYRSGIQKDALARAAPEGDDILKDYVSVEVRPLGGTATSTLFDTIVPGLLVFTIMLQTSFISSSLVRDIETGMLDRLKLSKIRAFDQLFGTFLMWTLITIGQITLLIGTAIALGYSYLGGFSALGLAVLIGVIAGMASISLALLVASFVKNEVQAMLLGTMIAVPLGFVAGAFIPLPRQVLGELAGRTYLLWEVFPWTWAVSAIRSVLAYGSGLSADVVLDLAWLIFLTAVLFIVGVAIYSRVRLRTAR
jgi:ABC-2 type transport system permease protein